MGGSRVVELLAVLALNGWFKYMMQPAMTFIPSREREATPARRGTPFPANGRNGTSLAMKILIRLYLDNTAGYLWLCRSLQFRTSAIEP